MQSTDRTAFAEAMQTTLEIYGRDLSDNALETWWRMLEPFSIEQVKHALRSHLEESPYPPKPADVFSRLQRNDGHPDADEAWTIALQAMDESTTVAWTDQIAKAKSAADPIFAEGDKVGARMAFKSAYERQLIQARQSGQHAKWWISAGHDPHEREQKVEQLLLEGKASPAQAQHHLPAPEAQTPALANAMRGALEKIDAGDDSG